MRLDKVQQGQVCNLKEVIQLNGNYNFNDVLNLASLLIGWQNLQENREQSAHNNIEAANSQQAEFLLNELNRRFEEQNEMLREILGYLKKG